MANIFQEILGEYLFLPTETGSLNNSFESRSENESNSNSFDDFDLHLNNNNNNNSQQQSTLEIQWQKFWSKLTPNKLKYKIIISVLS